MAPRARAATGQQVELGRYPTPDGERVLLGRRIDGVVHVYDAPAECPGPRYFVEAGFRSCAELAMLIADYLRQAEFLGCCPMSPFAVAKIAGVSVPNDLT
jgi:hypothetical protein